MGRNVGEVREEARRRQREAAEVRRGQEREEDRDNGEQARRIREVTREAAKMLRGDGPGARTPAEEDQGRRP